MATTELYRGDCLEVMEKIPCKSVDVVITDPPFGLAQDLPINEVLRRLQECERIAKRLVIIMDYRNFWKVDQLLEGKKVGELIWEYGWVSGGRTKAKNGFFPTHNTIGLYGDKKEFRFLEGSIIKRKPGFSSPRQCSYAKKTGHPYEKPIKLMEYLIIGSSNQDDTILDPFMGSGSTGVACVNTNRNFIGIELDENYFTIAKQRIEEAEKAVNK